MLNDKKNNADEVLQYLSFTVGKETFAINILRVQEIRAWEAVRELPDMPDYYKGVLDLRGVIVPIIDMRILFKEKEAEYSNTTVIIVINVAYEGETVEMGIVVDGVSDVYEFRQSSIKAPPQISRLRHDYLQGMVTRDDKMLVLLDIDKIMNEKELHNIHETVKSVQP